MLATWGENKSAGRCYKRMISGRRLFLKNVERRAEKMSPVECFRQGNGINDPAARSVDQQCRGLHGGEFLGSNQVRSFRRGGKMQGYSIGLLQSFIQRIDQSDFHPGRRDFHIGIIGDDFHAQTLLADFCHPSADCAQTDHTQRLPVKLNPKSEVRSAPAALRAPTDLPPPRAGQCAASIAPFVRPRH